MCKLITPSSNEERPFLPHHLPNNAPGYYVRLRRIFNVEDGRTVILPLDHGISYGPMPGLENPNRVLSGAVGGMVDAIILHAGLARQTVHMYANRLATIFAITSSGSALADHVLVGSVEQAVKYAADAIYVELKLGSPHELETIHMIGKVKREAERFDIPLLVAAYVYPDYKKRVGPHSILTACRMAAELGADIVKTNYPDTSELFVQIIEGTTVPVVVAGGAAIDEQKLFQNISDAIRLGAVGVAIGRNAWGSPNPQKILEKIHSIVHYK